MTSLKNFSFQKKTTAEIIDYFAIRFVASFNFHTHDSSKEINKIIQHIRKIIKEKKVSDEELIVEYFTLNLQLQSDPLNLNVEKFSKNIDTLWGLAMDLHDARTKIKLLTKIASWCDSLHLYSKAKEIETQILVSLEKNLEDNAQEIFIQFYYFNSYLVNKANYSLIWALAIFFCGNEGGEGNKIELYSALEKFSSHISSSINFMYVMITGFNSISNTHSTFSDVVKAKQPSSFYNPHYQSDLVKNVSRSLNTKVSCDQLSFEMVAKLSKIIHDYYSELEGLVKYNTSYLIAGVTLFIYAYYVYDSLYEMSGNDSHKKLYDTVIMPLELLIEEFLRIEEHSGMQVINYIRIVNEHTKKIRKTAYNKNDFLLPQTAKTKNVIGDLQTHIDIYRMHYKKTA